MSNACPRCGFDVERGASCPVCGPSHDGPRSLMGPIVTTAAIVAALAFFITADLADPGAVPAATAGNTGAQQAAAPAATPKKAKSVGSKLSPLKAAPAQEAAQTIRAAFPPTLSRASYVAWMLSHTDQKEKFLRQKWDLAQAIQRTKNITRTRILEAFLLTPREAFCRDTRRAYEDAVLPIGYGSTISGPYMVARMTDSLDPQPSNKVLEIGTGSGYQSALLSELCREVCTIEIVAPLAEETDAIYRKREAAYPEYRAIRRAAGDGYDGWPAEAPFDRIIVTCGIDHVPPELLHELAPEGIMVIPVGPPSGQTILRIVKHVSADGGVRLERSDIFNGRRREIFVPFVDSGGEAHRQGGEVQQ